MRWRNTPSSPARRSPSPARASSRAASRRRSTRPSWHLIAEFDSVEAAIKCHDGPAYQAALKVFNHAGERDFRIIEGLE